MRYLFCLVLCFCLLPLLNGCEVDVQPAQASAPVQEAKGKYDLLFKRWGEFYFPFDDWHWWKSQGIAESSLDPEAVSYEGAAGIMQLMPATANELGVKDRFDSEANIQGGIKYDKEVDSFFKKIDQPERRRYMFAGYNAGMGNVEKARKLSNSNIWDTTATFLHIITGSHSTETINYVKKILKIMEAL